MLFLNKTADYEDICYLRYILQFWLIELRQIIECFKIRRQNKIRILLPLFCWHYINCLQYTSPNVWKLEHTYNIFCRLFVKSLVFDSRPTVRAKKSNFCFRQIFTFWGSLGPKTPFSHVCCRLEQNRQNENFLFVKSEYMWQDEGHLKI